MRIKNVIFSAGSTGFFFDDQRAIKSGLKHDGFIYDGKPVTDGFVKVRQAGESISVMIELEDGRFAIGDCAAVQYSGAGGRDPLFLAENYIPYLEKYIAPKLIGRELNSFKDMATEFDKLQVEGKRLHTAIRYGISQAILDGVAKSRGKLMTEVVAEDYKLPIIAEPVPIFAQSGDERYLNADKMIIKGADVLPHALINAVDEKLGRNGEKLLEYVQWLNARIRQLGGESYKPCLHIDVYGTIALAFNNDADKMAEYLGTLEKAADPFKLYIEGPMDVGERQAQIDALAALKAALDKRGIGVKLVADEWCNTYEDVVAFTDAKCCHMVQIKTPDLGSLHNTAEAVLYCKKHGMEAYQGGTCNETDVSARACVHVALAVRSERILAKPGMGFDEGYMIVRNEMARTLAMLKARS